MDCGTPSSSRAGVGLSPEIEQENIKTVTLLQKALNMKTPSVDILAELSSSTVPVTRGLIESLRDDPDAQVLGQRLASEIAVAKTMEKMLLARRAVLTGMREPNVANNKDAQDELEKVLVLIDREIEQIRMEIDLQKSLTGNSAVAILQNKELREYHAGAANVARDNVDKRISDLANGLNDTSAETMNADDITIPHNNITFQLPQVSNSFSYTGTGGTSGTGSGGSGSASLKKYESKDAYADGRATVYRTPDGKLVRREGGSLAWRNNNPGNIRAGEFAKSLGAIGVGPGGFAIFPDAETGARAVGALMRTQNYKNLSIADAIARYAPPSENNTAAYQAAIRKQTGLDSTRKMSTLSDAELGRVVNAIRQHEGWKEGKTTTQ